MLQQVTKFKSSYSFGYLLRILLRAVNLFSFSHIVSSDSSFNIHNVLYFVKYPSRAEQNSPEGRRRSADRGLKTTDLEHPSAGSSFLASFFFIATSQMLPVVSCSFRRSVQVSAPYSSTLHSKHFVASSLDIFFSRVRRKCFSSC